MQLTELLDGDLYRVRHSRPNAGTDIIGLTCDSRRIKLGYLFAALPGRTVDGRNYINEALSRGAVAVLAASGTRLDEPQYRDIALLTDDNPRHRYAIMAARFFSLQPPMVAAVTGTNGKTSVVSFARQIWARLGRQAASIGTLGVVTNVTKKTRASNAGLTTPDPAELHKELRELTDQGVECVALEASSEGLDQHRLDGVRLSVAAFTNLSRDHLDYHGSMEDYLEAKQRLFAEVMGPGGTAVINADSDRFGAIARVAEVSRQRVISYGRDGREIKLLNLSPQAYGQCLSLSVMGRDYQVRLPLIGGFQSANALCALGLVLASGEKPDDAVAALENLEPVPGRVSRVATLDNGAMVYIDYAHTPDALANVLIALRHHTRGRLVLVFGCGGDRDHGKRSEMGRIVCGMADDVIITDDNPRDEEPAKIRASILAACPGGREIGDRAMAIRVAVEELGPSDLLIVAGKGHETGQVVGGEVLPLNDADVIRAALRDLGS